MARAQTWDGQGNLIIDKSETDLDKNISEKVSVMLFGAKGDGVSDDTTAIQSALDYCKNSHELYFPNGIYLTDTLHLSKDSKYTLKGCMIGNDGYYISLPFNCEIRLKSTSTVLFDCGDQVDALPSIMVNLERLYFRGGSVDSYFFKDIKLIASKIHDCCIREFGYVLAGAMTQCTKIYDCQITNICNSLLSTSPTYSTEINNIVDSDIHDNYLSGDNAHNITLLNLGNPSTARVYNNYIDFCKYVIDRSNNSGDISFTNNIFDCCFRFCRRLMSKTRITGNEFRNFSINSIGIFTNPDSDMLAEPWGVFYCTNDTSKPRCYGFSDSIIKDNIVINCDSFLNGVMVDSISGEVRISDNIMVSVYDVAYSLAVTYAANIQNANVYIDGLEEIPYESLPALVINDKTNFYKNQKILYNKKVLVNRDWTQWYDLMGNVVAE